MTILSALESIRSTFLTVIMSFFSFFGGETLLILFLAIMYWCVDKKFAHKIIFSFAVSGSIIRLLKIVFCIPRPWVLYSGLSPVYEAESNAVAYSFPSAHTNISTCISVNSIRGTKRKIVRFLSWIILLLVPFSRMYLGVQTLFSVVLSLIITLIITIVVDKLVDEMVWDKRHYILIVIMIMAIPVVSGLFAISQYANGLADYANISGSLKMAGVGIGAAISWYYETLFIKFNEKTVEVWQQFLKVLIGLIGILFLKYALGMLFTFISNAPWFGDFFRYLMMTVFGMGIYPMIIKKYFSAAY